ncbi:MAG: hydrogen gas-evolving membrane-bound hydrogenase subunit E [Phycisphaerales bacterium JB038]
MESSVTLLILISVFAPVVISLLTLALPRQAITARTLISIASALLSTGCLVAVMVGRGFAGGPVGVPLAPALDIALTFNPDRLGLFFALLVAGIGIFINTYARGYFGRDPDELYRFYPTNGFFMTAMIGAMLSDNLLGLLIFWEMTAISSFLLIGWERNDKTAVKLAMQAFITTGAGGLSLMAGLILLGLATGHWSLSTILTSDLSGVDGTLLTAAFLCMFFGAAAKSAQWPFHFWLPGAMAAPTPVSAYLHSATMVKAGVYLFARMYPAFRHLELWPVMLIGFGTLTMVIGGYLALRNHDLKKIFAYTTVSQLALFTCMYGLGAFDYTPHHGHAVLPATTSQVEYALVSSTQEHADEGHADEGDSATHAAEDGHAGADDHATAAEPNTVWPLMQIVNHALYKAPLFILAGAIGHLAGSRDIRRLGGLLKSKHKLLAWLTLFAGYAMAAGPFTLSFNGKEAFLYGIYHAAQQNAWLWIVAGAAVFMALANVAVFIRLLTTFAGLKGSMAEELPEEEAHHHHEHEHGFWGACIWWPAAALLLFQLVGGIFAGPFGSFWKGIETHPNYWGNLPWFWEISFTTAPVYLSLLAIALGVILGLSRLWRSFFNDPHNHLYPGFYWLAVTGGGRAFRTVQTGNFRHYVVLTLIAALAGIIATAVKRPDFFDAAAIEFPLAQVWPGLLIAIVICVTALLLPIVQQRVVRVLILGTTGFSVTAMYLLYQAPDLALTQLMFEIISVILFLLVLRMLPVYDPKPKNYFLVSARIVVSAAIGLSIGYLTYMAATTDLSGMQKLGDFFIQHSYAGSPATHGHGGGGNNIVNVILVDFRGFDTLGEITVLGIAALGVWSLMRRRESSNLDFKPVHNALNIEGNGGPGMSSIIFRTSQRILLPLSLVFAVFVFMKGHQEPGGGFIAGLIAAVALAILRMALGPGALRKLLPAKASTLVIAGLGLALATGTGALFFGLPFFTSDHGYLGSGVNQVEWATVMLFDLGVFFVVTGVSVGMIMRLSEEIE